MLRMQKYIFINFYFSIGMAMDLQIAHLEDSPLETELTVPIVVNHISAYIKATKEKKSVSNFYLDPDITYDLHDIEIKKEGTYCIFHMPVVRNTKWFRRAIEHKISLTLKDTYINGTPEEILNKISTNYFQEDQMPKWYVETSIPVPHQETLSHAGALVTGIICVLGVTSQGPFFKAHV